MFFSGVFHAHFPHHVQTSGLFMCRLGSLDRALRLCCWPPGPFSSVFSVSLSACSSSLQGAHSETVVPVPPHCESLDLHSQWRSHRGRLPFPLFFTCGIQARVLYVCSCVVRTATFLEAVSFEVLVFGHHPRKPCFLVKLALAVSCLVIVFPFSSRGGLSTEPFL